jgi:GNAT superfamily N-acetyltransferase
MRAEAVETALARFVDQVRAIFADRLRAVVVYGPHATRDAAPARAGPVNLLVLASSVTAADLAAAAVYVPRWRRQGLATPLLLGAEEFARSLDAFPLEYGDILARHRVLVGEEPFAGMVVRAEDVRRACELQVKSHLIHLREGFLETAGRPADVAALVERAAPAFVALADTLARLEHGATADREAAMRLVQQAAGLPPEVARRVTALAEGHRLGRREAVAFFRHYLAAVERLAEYVDRWRR